MSGQSPFNEEDWCHPHIGCELHDRLRWIAKKCIDEPCEHLKTMPLLRACMSCVEDRIVVALEEIGKTK